MMGPSELELFEQIAKFHRELNRAEVVPPNCYRRNKVRYDLVSYINNIIGLVLSENYEVIPVFIGRALSHMEAFPSNSESLHYYSCVNRYLALVATLVLSRGVSLGDFVPAPFVEAICVNAS
ncbi:hypothetical protein GCM10025771_13720 [Niveibacterium umoris]